MGMIYIISTVKFVFFIDSAKWYKKDFNVFKSYFYYFKCYTGQILTYYLLNFIAQIFIDNPKTLEDLNKYVVNSFIIIGYLFLYIDAIAGMIYVTPNKLDFQFFKEKIEVIGLRIFNTGIIFTEPEEIVVIRKNGSARLHNNKIPNYYRNRAYKRKTS
ncbi:Hypothetical protein SRAE_X000226500 [Strongyloides ratti]|uniref:Uncharacterized protein n=1 Tax=Strongyloides ratti TaxID=34506 RepID=A0A090MQS6_STRRB|nr:Hypothetical protein SRAE_X000226500 [Strongyloides ratti]CEF60528.1 Hypothetical protein SRAE_X000226500 [Strongyloides ratti]